MNPYFESEYGESRMLHSCPGLIHVVKEGILYIKSHSIIM